MKTSLLVANDSRDETRDSDSWGTNVLLDAEVPAAAVKRPGLTLTYDGTAPGQGVFIWPDSGEPTVVAVEDDELTFPVITEIGDLVDDWYAMVEDPPTPPGPDDPYWSSTPPGAARYLIAAIGLNVLNDALYQIMLASAVSPLTDQLVSKVAASENAALVDFQTRLLRIYGIISWEQYGSAEAYPGHALNPVSRIYPTSSLYILDRIVYADIHKRLSTESSSWVSAYPIGFPVPSVSVSTPFYPYGYVFQQSTVSGVTITSSGSLAKIYAPDIGIAHGSYALQAARYIEVSGANEVEYNGKFKLQIIQISPESFIDALNTFEYYYQMRRVPSSATATGTVVVKVFI